MSNIRDVEMVKQHNDDMLLYSIYVARKRVIPDYRDGLKCVHRRIIFDMYNDLHAINTRVKTARVAGDVIGKYHPHGDTAVADAMKPMTNDWECKVPYIVGQGNWGDPKGSPAANGRYTECKLSDYSMDCIIANLKETDNAVDWEDNYSDTLLEPIYLPAIVPNLLINGAYGIASGLSVDIPRHNFGEVVDATIELMKNPKAKVRLVPDNCMQTQIYSPGGFDKICETGRGKYRVRANIEITEYKGKAAHHVGKPALKITSVPDLVFFDKIKADIEALIVNKKLPQIVDMISESSADDKGSQYIREWIILKKGSDANYVRSVLYSATHLENGRGVNFEILKNNAPVLVSYKEYLLDFIQFRRMNKFRIYCNNLKTEKTKYHKMELYIKALESGEIDNIYKKIRTFKGTDDPEYIEYLIKKLHVTDIQAKYLLDIDFRKISNGYLNKYKKIRDESMVLANHYLAMMDDEKAIDNEIISEMLAAKAKYGNPRMSKLITANQANSVPAGTFKIVITGGNFIKKFEPNAPINGLNGDTVRCAIIADNRDNVIIFGNLGKVYKIPVSIISFELTDIRFILKTLTSDITDIVMESKLAEFGKNKHRFIYTLTRDGYIKRMDCTDFENVAVSGLIYTRLDDGDIVSDIMFSDDRLDFLVYAGNKVLRLDGKDAPYLRRSSKGNYSMKTTNPMGGMISIGSNDTSVVVITNKGYVNRVPLEIIKQMKRMQTGINITKLGKGDGIKYMFVCNDNDCINFHFSQSEGQLVKVSDIPLMSTASMGTVMNKLGIAPSKVAFITKQIM